MDRLSVVVSHLGGELPPPPATAATLVGKVAVITGAAQGIGLATARLFVAHGAKVVLTDIDAVKLQAAVETLTADPELVRALAGDITEPTMPQKVIDFAVAAFGDIHYLVNNAGFVWDALLHNTTDEQWDRMISIHQTAPFRLSRALVQHLRKSSSRSRSRPPAGAAVPVDRCIVNVTSVSALKGNVGQAGYSAAKAALIGLTKTVAKEGGPLGVRCNAIAFGFIDTRLTRSQSEGEVVEVRGTQLAVGMPASRAITTPRYAAWATSRIALRRFGTASEAAGAVVGVCLPAYASYLTGQCVEVSGGLE